MADIDMIPRSWREARRVRRLLRNYGSALAALLVLTAAASAGLRWQSTSTEPVLARLRADSVSAGDGGTRLAALQARQAILESGVVALDRLRGSGSAARLAELLDQSLGSELWLVGIHYQRSEQRLLETTGAGAPRADDLQVSVAGAQERWRVTRRVNLNGGALTYPALTEFMRGFASHGGVSEVRLVDSRTAEEAASGVNPAAAAAAPAVSFEVTALLGATGVAP
jgi:hypothetical protein